MKKLSDYQDEEALELWADLLDPLSEILTNEKVKKAVGSGKSQLKIAQTIIKECPKEIKEVLLRIDPEPLNGFNLIMRVVNLLAEIGSNSETASFFGYAEQVKKNGKSSGLPTANTEAEEK